MEDTNQKTKFINRKKTLSKILNYEPHCTTGNSCVQKGQILMWFSFSATIVSTTLNPNSPGHSEARTTQLLLTSDSCLSRQSIWTEQTHHKPCGWTCFPTKKLEERRLTSGSLLHNHFQYQCIHKMLAYFIIGHDHWCF